MSASATNTDRSLRSLNGFFCHSLGYFAQKIWVMPRVQIARSSAGLSARNARDSQGQGI